MRPLPLSLAAIVKIPLQQFQADDHNFPLVGQQIKR
jgi:hypothetical protein